MIPLKDLRYTFYTVIVTSYFLLFFHYLFIGHRKSNQAPHSSTILPHFKKHKSHKHKHAHKDKENIELAGKDDKENIELAGKNDKEDDSAKKNNDLPRRRPRSATFNTVSMLPFSTLNDFTDQG